jgi:NTE family protein
VHIATAVAASVAFPLFPPAMRRTFTFERDCRRTRETVVMSDGGVYDNLGLSVLEPGRSPMFTPHVYDVRYLISCDAGRGELRLRSPRLLIGRLWRSFDVVHRRAQDAGRARLHEWLAAGRIDGFVMAYLGMRDERLSVPISDLVPRESVAGYGTNFSAMEAADLERLSTRGEQLLRSLLPIHCLQLTSRVELANNSPDMVYGPGIPMPSSLSESAPTTRAEPLSQPHQAVAVWRLIWNVDADA